MSNERLLPEAALARIHASQTAGGNWSSDLSVAELAAIRAVGFEPVDVVMGSSIFHIGTQWGGGWGASLAGYGGWNQGYPCTYGWSYGNEHRTGYNWEHVQYQQGMDTAYRLAHGRLIEETRALGAHGVVGTRTNISHQNGTGGVVEFTVIGTAIRRAGAQPLPNPFTSNLRGQEFAKLIQGGMVPAALVYVMSAVEVIEGCAIEHQAQTWSSNEIPQLAEAVHYTRERAIAQLEEVATGVGESVVGVKIDFQTHHIGLRHQLVHMAALGTAVHRFSDAPLPQPPLTIMKLS